jgi:alpha-L-fucosidase
MNSKLRFFLTQLLAVIALATRCPAVGPPAPLAPVPTAQQLAWNEDDAALYLNFGINTFTGLEEGTGREDPKLFNPTHLDARQWASVAKEAGFKRLILPAKGREGFCLWPDEGTDFSVKASPWRNGKGDVVREFTDACRQAGLKAGLQVWAEDRRDPAYGTGAYNAVYERQLTELLTGYGEIAEVRFDGTGAEGTGAVGSIGPSPAERKQAYDWKGYFATVSRLQPGTIMVSSQGPGARWNGNNIGHCGEPNWAPFDPSSVPGVELTDRKQLSVLNSGDSKGSLWLPPETCIRMRPGWFWHAAEDSQILPLDKLVNAYFKSAGRNAIFMLSVPIDDRGLIPDADAQRLKELHEALGKIFQSDLAQGKAATASNVRGNDPVFGAAKAVDGDRDTYWATDDGVTSGCWLEVDLGQPMTFDVSAVRENIVLGQRVMAYRIDYQDGSEWKTAIRSKSIGRLKLERFAQPVTARRVRLLIEESRACPAIASFSLYKK